MVQPLKVKTHNQNKNFNSSKTNGILQFDNWKKKTWLDFLLEASFALSYQKIKNKRKKNHNFLQRFYLLNHAKLGMLFYIFLYVRSNWNHVSFAEQF